MPLIEINHIFKSYSSFFAIDDISLLMHEGECLGLLGPNGAGKSTLINLIYGVSIPSKGEIKVFGLSPTQNYRQVRAQIGVVPQQNALDQNINVENNLIMFAQLAGIPKKERKPRVDELLSFMSLDHKKSALIQNLSGGMQRRLAFVRALINKPKLLILDEPTTGLDPAVRQLLWAKVEELKLQGTSILITTHYMDEAEQLCDRIIIMDKGKIKESGSPKELIKRHNLGFLAIFKNLSPAKISFLEREVTTLFPEYSFLTHQNFSYLKGPRIEQLLHIASDLSLPEPNLIRPANLEDVFLILTGRHIGHNA